MILGTDRVGATTGRSPLGRRGRVAEDNRVHPVSRRTIDEDGTWWLTGHILGSALVVLLGIPRGLAVTHRVANATDPPAE